MRSRYRDSDNGINAGVPHGSEGRPIEGQGVPANVPHEEKDGMRRTRDGRTARQIEADELDLSLFRLANRLAASGYNVAARKLDAARHDVRAQMHPDDIRRSTE